ncbi:MAG: kinase/pyrophosphorylase [Alicyclobacillaceae bacterium]|jgi:regulator of PEP synthase PpsR (kinase-PPPase family)|nr:kinase/pyrophosphorylase [Alicyclobacillaceae bacterium]
MNRVDSVGPIVYLVSDSVGETAEAVVRATASQFNGGQVLLRRVAHVATEEALMEAVDRAVEENALIAYTIVVPRLREVMLRLAAERKVAAVDIMGPMVSAFEQLVGHPPHLKAGLVHQLDADYFRRVDAIEFAVKYDDGRDPRGLEKADIIIVGVSRTSKTPLSMYLAHKRMRVANVPLVPEVAPPEELFHLEAPHRIVGLTIRKEELNRIRQARLKALGLTADASYASPERIAEELNYAHRVMERLRCPVIDVSDRAVEETAHLILDLVSRPDTKSLQEH